MTVRPFRCFNRRLMWCALILLVVLFGLVVFGKTLPKHSVARYLVAVAEGAVFGWFVFETIRSIQKLDELERRIHAEAMAVAAAITTTLVSASGYLETAGMPRVEWSVFIVPFVTVTWVLGVILIRRKYQ